MQGLSKSSLRKFRKLRDFIKGFSLVNNAPELTTPPFYFRRIDFFQQWRIDWMNELGIHPYGFNSFICGSRLFDEHDVVRNYRNAVAWSIIKRL